MKGLLVPAFILANLFGCKPYEAAPGDHGSMRLVSGYTASVQVSIYQDTDTGCEYLVSYRGGITPRIAADYMHMGCKGVQDNE